MKILILNGPNLNLLGARETGVYGTLTLNDIQLQLEKIASKHKIELEFFQSNYEGELVDKIQSCLSSQVDFILINPAALTHTSIALRDALLAVKVPFIEIHLSNIHAREEFRHHSYLSDIARGVVCGLGEFGYRAAINFAIEHLLSSASNIHSNLKEAK